MSATFEFLPIGNAKPATPREKLEEHLAPHFSIKFSDKTVMNVLQDFQVFIENERLKKRYAEPIEFYYDDRTYHICTTINPSAFTSDEEVIFMHVLGMIAEATNCGVHSDITGEDFLPGELLSPSIAEELTKPVQSAAEVSQANKGFAAMLKKSE